MEKIILTGDRPTGKLHLGHYVGSIKKRLEMQASNDYDKMYVMIADSQALTDNFDNPSKIRESVKEIILDCKEMSSKEKAHEYIMKKMNFPDYYGKNLDALYDILSTYDKEVYVKFINFESLFKQLGDYAVSLIDVFREAEEENTKLSLVQINKR